MKEGWGKETGGPCGSAVPARASSSPADTELSCSKQTYPSMPRWVRVVGFPHRLPEGLSHSACNTMKWSHVSVTGMAGAHRQQY